MDQTVQWLLILFAVGMVVWVVSNHLQKSKGAVPNKGNVKKTDKPVDPKQAAPGLDPFNGGDPVYQDTNGMTSRNPIGNCLAPEAQWLSSSLLPKNDSMMSNDVNLFDSSQIANQNFLEAGWQIGRDTVSNSLRNANLQIRSDPPIPKSNDFTWIQKSSIGPDTNRRPLEVGSHLQA